MSQRMLLRRWMASVGLVVGATSVMAQDVQPVGGSGLGLGRPAATVPCPTGNCPPAIPVIPCPTPTTPAPTTMPGAPVVPGQPTPTTTNPDVSNIVNSPSSSVFDASLAPSAGTRSSASLAPNIMGDILGARAVQLRIARDLQLAFPSVPRTDTGVLVTPGTGRAVLIPRPGDGGSTYFFNNGQPLTQLNSINSYSQRLLAGQASITPDQALATQAVLQAALSGRQLTPAQIAALPPEVRGQAAQLQSAVNREIAGATKGLTVQNITVGPVSGQVVPGTPLAGNRVADDLIYTTTLTGVQNVPFPGTSSTVGRIKISEDNSPLPRDRWIFVYDHFDGVPFTSDGIQVNRFQFGFEKTFWDGRASFEFRLPFAGTLASTTVQGQEVTDMELGNVRMALKYLWTNSSTWNISTGAAISLPTANDITVLGVNPASTNGTVPFYHFRNESVQVEPFAAVLYTPNDRLFAQLFTGINFDVSGGQFTWNKEIFGGNGSSRIWDLPLLSVDYQIGYWLFRNDFSTIRGIAPFVELHWNYLVAQDILEREVRDELRSNGLNFSTFGSHELNLTAGATTQIGNNMLITLGGTAPLLQSPNRLFDAQFGLRVNYFFGRTARERSVANSVSGF